MKRLVVFLMTSMLLVAVAGCTNVATDIPEESAPVETESEPTTMTEDEIREENAKIIADALDKTVQNDRVKNLADLTIDPLQTGLLVGGEYAKEDPDEVLYLMAEDGTEYKFILSATGVWAVENVTTGEWPIQSYQ